MSLIISKKSDRKCISKFHQKFIYVSLRWSGLTMGGILVVCLAGASTSLTIEAEVRVTMSFA